MNKKYLFSLVAIALLIAFSIMLFCVFISPLVDYIDRYNYYTPNPDYAIFAYLSVVLFCVFVFSMCVLQLILILRKTNFTNYTRLAYEEFKEKRIAKKENKRKAKIEKLQKQLNEIEKDA